MSSEDSRRIFIKQAAVTGLGISLGSANAFASTAALDQVAVNEQDPYELFGKHPDMLLLNDKPWNMEATAHLLDDSITPSEKMFIRNNGKIPTKIDINKWTLQVLGESAKSKKTYSLHDLRSKFKTFTYQLTIECGGNGRSEFDPPAKGNQWTVGAISCAEWTGVRLKDVLKDVGINEDAVYIGYYGEDVHLSGDHSKHPISRGIPLAKAMEDETIIAFAMNGQDIPEAHGYPLRLIVGGYPGSASGKWLSRLVIRDKIHDGAKMAAPSYSVPIRSVAPGEEVPTEEMKIIEEMPVKSLITYPKTGAVITLGQQLPIRGHAWSGHDEVIQVEYSIDFGASWKVARLESPVNKFAWQHFNAIIDFTEEGYYEVWAAATDKKGNRQPMLVPGWNPKGYLNNACHRIAVRVVAA